MFLWGLCFVYWWCSEDPWDIHGGFAKGLLGSTDDHFLIQCIILSQRLSNEHDYLSVSDWGTDTDVSWDTHASKIKWCIIIFSYYAYFIFFNGMLDTRNITDMGVTTSPHPYKIRYYKINLQYRIYQITHGHVDKGYKLMQFTQRDTFHHSN